MAKYWKLLPPSILALVAYFSMGTGEWDAARQGLAVALSMLGAAVFVRLARGMPVTNSDGLTLEDVKNISAAVDTIFGRLSILLKLVVFSILFLVFIIPIQTAVQQSDILTDELKLPLCRGISAALAFLIGFVTLRVFDVIAGDRDLLNVQAECLRKSFLRKAGTKVESEISAASAVTPLIPRPGYGKPLQRS